jgi:hypothetical protein
MANPILFEVATPLGFSVPATRAHWELIVAVKHPIMHGREAEVQRVLQAPEEVRAAAAIQPSSSFSVQSSQVAGYAQSRSASILKAS